MKKIKFFVLVLAVMLVSTASYAARGSYSEMASRLEHESRHLMKTLKYRVGSRHSASRDAHTFYHAAKDFANRCIGIVAYGDRVEHQLKRDFVRIEYAFNNLVESIQRSRKLSHARSVRRDTRRVESKYHVLKNSLNRNSNSKVNSDDDDDTQLDDY